MGNKLRKVHLYIKKKSPSDFIMTLMAVATDVNYRFLKRLLLESVWSSVGLRPCLNPV